MARRSVALGQVPDQLDYVVGEVVRSQVTVTPKSPSRSRVGARCPSDSEIDPARVKRLERAELLSHYKRGVVGKHDATRADPDDLAS